MLCGVYKFDVFFQEGPDHIIKREFSVNFMINLDVKKWSSSILQLLTSDFVSPAMRDSHTFPAFFGRREIK